MAEVAAGQKASVTAQTHYLCCARCGYGVAVRREPPRCPMCGGQVWLSRIWRRREAGAAA